MSSFVFQAVATKLKRQTHALDNVLKSGQAGLSKLLNDRSKTNEKDLFELPARNQEFVESSSSDEEGNEVKYAALSMLETGGLDIHSLDVESAYFKVWTLVYRHPFLLFSAVIFFSFGQNNFDYKLKTK